MVAVPSSCPTTSAFANSPSSWSPDGRLLSFGQVDPATGNDIWVLSASGEKAPTPFANSAFGEWDGFFSPDGRALVYTSIESGRLEVYVRPYPGPGGRRQVSTDGGNSPVWARTGKELFDPERRSADDGVHPDRTADRRRRAEPALRGRVRFRRDRAELRRDA